jgi:SAM-dependent methyltransferase
MWNNLGMNPHHAQTGPSPWVMRFAAQFAPGSQILDVACGGGRHARALAAAGHEVTAIDRDEEALHTLQGIARIRPIHGNLETLPPDQAWPFSAQQFDAIVVTNYLHRPLFTHMLASLKPGGWLVYETFAHGNASYGKPSRPDFLLRRGELLAVAQGLQVVAFEDGVIDKPQRAVVQRIAAVKPMSSGEEDGERVFLL